MANNLFNVGGPLGPITPGGSGFANPLAQLGFGIYQGNPLAAMQGMALQQQAGARLAMAQEQMRLEAEARRAAAEQRERQTQAAMSLMPSMQLGLAPDASRQFAQAFPGKVVDTAMARLKPPEATPAMIEAQTYYPGDPIAQAKYVTEARMKPLVQQNLGQLTERGKRISERQSLVTQHGAGSPEVKRYDLSTLSPTQQTSLGQLEPARQMLNNIEDLVGDEPGAGLVDLSGPTLGFRSRAAASPTFSRLPGADLTDEEAQLATYTKQLSNTMLALMRGAQVGPQEQARFEEQLPVMGQDENVFRANLAATKQNLEYLTNLYKAQAPSLFENEGQSGWTDAKEAERQELLRKARER